MRTIDRLLVANRGEIACRIMRSARALGIRTVAVFSDADRDAPHVQAADEAVHLAGNTPAETYLRADLLIEAARRTGADAVHPGYGFLSEQAAFAGACAQAGLVFVGPPPHAIEQMGSKIEAKRLMAAAGVPVLESVPGHDLAGACERIGFPMLVKAAFGGGGRGMRIVRDEASLASAVAQAEREAASAFGDGTVFIERYVEAPRHIEVQIFADAHGSVVHLFERECSIQRRHQKIIEEAPSPAVDEVLRARLGAAAVAAAQAIGYVNAGTVEFVLDAQGEFFFLEVNTRLQVEHPVTELITGLDLVALQLQVAQGAELPPEVRTARIEGHAIEARLYAEDVAAGFLPATGVLHRLRIDGSDGVRVDTGYADGSVVSPFYDAMLAKVIAWAPTRADAARRLADTLRRAEVHGVVTNRDLLVGVLRHEEFLAGATDTGFLDRHDPAGLQGAPSAELVRRHAVAAARAARRERRDGSPVPAGVPAAWRNVGPADQPVSYTCGPHTVVVQTADLDGPEEHPVAARVHRVGPTVYVDSALGSCVLEEVPRFPAPVEEVAAGSLRSPMPGSVTRIVVTPGASVTAGDVLLTLEAMKMEHTLRAPHDGTVREIRVEVGEQVASGTVLVVVDPREQD